MLNSAELSLDQAPPLSVPFRFFLTAPLFGLAAGILVLVQGPGLMLTRWLPDTIALTHLITLGFLLMVTCGALLQLLPVLVASPLPRVVAVGTSTHLLLTLGTASLAAAFLSGSRLWMPLSLALLGAALALFILAVGIALLRVRQHSATVVAMKLALLALTLTLVTGLLSGGTIIGLLPPGLLATLTDIHLNWALGGALGLLLIGVAYQVVPLFQVTPEYPAWMRKTLAPGAFGILLTWTLLQLAAVYAGWPEQPISLWAGFLAAIFALFAAVTLRLQSQRRRRTSDITLKFWRVAMVVMVLCLPLWGLGYFNPGLGESPRFSLLFGALMISGVAVPVVNGMLYKIIAFLPWFHLQHRQLALTRFDVVVPHMKAFVPQAAADRQFMVWLLSFSAGLAALFWPQMSRPAGLLFAVSNLLLFHNMLVAVALYRRTENMLRAPQS